jgi:hypothetical protein
VNKDLEDLKETIGVRTDKAEAGQRKPQAQNTHGKSWGVAPAVKHLPSKHKSLNPRTS